jgi:hypothetical protein
VLDFTNLSARVRVSGYGYEVKTGLLTTTVAPRRRGTA